MAAKFTVSQGKNGKYFFNLKATNGEIILASQGYKSRAGCMKGIESVKTNSSNQARYEEKTAKNGKAFFILKARNGQVVGQSQMYQSPKMCSKGLKSVTKNASKAKITVV